MALLTMDWHERGGIERCVAQEAAGLAGAGWQVDVFAGRVAGPAPAGVRVVDLGAHGRPWARRLLQFAQRGAKAVAAAGPYDVVHAHGVYLGRGHLAHAHSVHAVSLRKDRPSHWFARAEAWVKGLPPLARRLSAETFRNAATCVAVSQSVAQELRQEYGLPSGRVKVLYMGVDAAAFRPRPLAARRALRASLGLDGGFWALFCGWNWRRKGLDTVLKAMERLPEARLLVVGEDPIEGGAFRRLAEPLGSRVRFAGRMEPVEGAFQACDAFVFPTRYEPFGMVVTEAMAAGLPVLLPRGAGAAEVIGQGRAQQVLGSPDDPDALATAWGRLLAAPRRARALGTANRRKALALSWGAHVKGLRTIYRQRSHWQV